MPLVKFIQPKYLLITIALLYLLLVLLVPAVSVFYEAFHKGFGVFKDTLQDANFQTAVGLSVVITLIGVTH